jgi:hypothetical protein
MAKASIKVKTQGMACSHFSSISLKYESSYSFVDNATFYVASFRLVFFGNHRGHPLMKMYLYCMSALLLVDFHCFAQTVFPE